MKNKPTINLKFGQGTLKEALRISIYLAVIPFLLISYLLYTHPDTEPLYYSCTVFILIILVFASIYPFVRDVIELTRYFKNLLYRREVKMPIFASFAAASQLPEVLMLLKKSWEETNEELSKKVLESKVLFNTIPNIILLLNTNLVITSANDAAHNTLGTSLIGQDLEQLLKDKNLIGAVRLVMHDKIGKQIEISLNDIMPRFYRVKIEIFGVNPYSALQNILLVFDDITETKRAETTFIDFVANASHEIRTPITSIIGISETLLNAGYDDKEAFDNFMPMIYAQASRMKQLINDLLSLASIEKQLTSPPSDLIDIKEVIAFVIKQLEWELSQNKITLKADLSDNLCPICGDRNQLVQVFYNLITNAIKYGKTNTEIIIEAEETEIPHHRDSGMEEFHRMLMISIRDFGEGIAHEDIERLTERFFRVDKSRSKKIGGTGLGLSIVKQILIRHNGFLDIKSKVREGSTFTVYLPIYEHFNELIQEHDNT